MPPIGNMEAPDMSSMDMPKGFGIVGVAIIMSGRTSPSMAEGENCSWAQSMMNRGLCCSGPSLNSSYPDIGVVVMKPPWLEAGVGSGERIVEGMARSAMEDLTGWRKSEGGSGELAKLLLVVVDVEVAVSCGGSAEDELCGGVGSAGTAG